MKRFLMGPNDLIFVAKPDALRRGLTGQIRRELRKGGFHVLFESEMRLGREDVKALYQDSFRRDYPKGEEDERAEKHIAFWISATSHAYLVRHGEVCKPDLFEIAKMLRGEEWISYRCSKESIRFRLRNTDFDHYSPEFTVDGFLVGPVPENVIHATLNEGELERTFGIFFGRIAEASNLFK